MRPKQEIVDMEAGRNVAWLQRYSCEPSLSEVVRDSLVVAAGVLAARAEEVRQLTEALCARRMLADQLSHATERVSRASSKTQHEDSELHVALGDLYGCVGRAVEAMRGKDK